ncbi:dipeptidase PepV [Microbacteriaceae bacterium 4G12]
MMGERSKKAGEQMKNINWLEEVMNRKDELIRDTQQFLRIKSILEEDQARPGAPFGEGINQALSFMLEKGEQDGFISKNVDGYGGHLEMGEGEELLGILCHVDVVPEGDGWTSDPYGAEIRNGNLYARGALDDKGPTMAAYYAMKIVKELELPLTKRVRMILGTDEESQWRCVDYYFKKEEMPTIGFVPDADFPIINAEKGICDLYLIQKEKIAEGKEATLVEFTSGRRFNMVPDIAKAVVRTNNVQSLVNNYEQYLKKTSRQGNVSIEGNTAIFEMEGLSVHGSTPEKGINAGVYLAAFLAGQQLDGTAAAFVQFIAQSFLDDTIGQKLGIQYNDEATGDLTINVGRISYSQEEGGKLGLNIRYPVTANWENTLAMLAERAHEFTFEKVAHLRPHHVAKDHALIRTLQRVYEEQTGEEATLLSTGGGTYARSLKAGVAFGPLFPGKEEFAHQKDEYIEIEDLLKATAIYAQAIYELAR